MPKAARLGDVGSGHGCFPPSNAVAGSPDVSINGQPAVRSTDDYAAHGCGVCSPHGRKLAKGSSTVSVNGLDAGRIGDPIDCGGAAATGSPNVFIGDVGLGSEGWQCMQQAKEKVEAFLMTEPQPKKKLPEWHFSI